jgi:holo-[acyl-carrier protein] synthase
MNRDWQLSLDAAASGGLIRLPGGSRGVQSAGVDLVDVARFRRAVERSGEPFVRRVFAEQERAAVSTDADRRVVELAALFGVKESVVKAIGGMPRGGSYADIRVEAGAAGSRRAIQLAGEFGRWATGRRVDFVAGSAPAGDGMLLAWALAVTTVDADHTTVEADWTAEEARR